MSTTLKPERIEQIRSDAETLGRTSNFTAQCFGLINIARNCSFGLEDVMSDNPRLQGMAQSLQVILKRLHEEVFNTDPEED